MVILYDDMLTVGRSARETAKDRIGLLDLELPGFVPENSSSGLLLFLAKEVNIRESYCLQAAGYRFTSVKEVIGNLSTSIQSNMNIMTQWQMSIRDYVSTDHTLERGVHLACFTIRASMGPGRGGFKVLVRKDATNLLPTMQLPVDRIERWQAQYLSKLDSATLLQ